ncbi:MAG: hypothetical protein ACE37I_06465 [Rubinisphaera brasiliensis]|uniref:hypothetical protein n=1 Tax=Rubinisphaera brasiliensis TaxID=119 RepID=UPI00391D8F0C
MATAEADWQGRSGILRFQLVRNERANSSHGIKTGRLCWDSSLIPLYFQGENESRQYSFEFPSAILEAGWLQKLACRLQTVADARVCETMNKKVLDPEDLSMD